MAEGARAVAGAGSPVGMDALPAAVREKVTHHNIGTVMGQVVRAQILVRLGRHAEALGVAAGAVRLLRPMADHRTGVENYPTTPVVRFSRDFIVSSTAAQDVTNEFVIALDTYAYALAGEGRDWEALAACEEATARARRRADADPDHAKHLACYLRRQGEAQLAVGDDEAAQRSLAEAERLQPPADRRRPIGGRVTRSARHHRLGRRTAGPRTTRVRPPTTPTYS